MAYLVGSLKHTRFAGFSEITVVALFAPLPLRNDLPLFLSSLSLAVQGNAPQQKLDLRAVERFFEETNIHPDPSHDDSCTTSP
jgi:hypothetical protein